jgi:glycine cleavage system H protein
MEVRPLEIPIDCLYDPNHYWVKVTGSTASIGLTAYGENIIGDILYLELVSDGTIVKKGERVGSIESSKWVGTLLTPIAGKVLRKNDKVEVNPRLVNIDPYATGWLLLVEISNLGELDGLMKAEVYEKWVEEQIGREREEDEAI